LEEIPEGEFSIEPKEGELKPCEEIDIVIVFTAIE
jgi:hypothetical protein